MGHYDVENAQIIEASRQQAARNIRQKDELCEIIDSLNYADTVFAEELLTNLDSYKGFFKILDRSRKWTNIIGMPPEKK